MDDNANKKNARKAASATWQQQNLPLAAIVVRRTKTEMDITMTKRSF
jgi:hypothetical protein